MFKKNFLSETDQPGQMTLVWKHPKLVQIQVCSNHDPKGQGGTPMGVDPMGVDFFQKYIEQIFKNVLP